MAVKFLRLPEVAERLGLSLHTIRRWAAERRIPVTKMGRAVLVSETELAKFVEARTQRPRSDVSV